MFGQIAKLSLACALAGGVSLAVLQPAAGEERSALKEKRHRVAVGFGAWGVRSPLEGADDEPESGLFPYLSYENDWLSVDPSGAAVTLLGNDHFALQGVVAPRWLFVDPDDSAIHDDLKRKTGVDLGARLAAMSGPLSASIEYRGDVSDRSNGHEATGVLGAEIELPGRGTLGLKGGAYWRDSKLSTYLYGVFPDEARAGRPAYRVKEGFTPFAGASVSYPVIDRVEVVVAAEAEFLPERIADSPIIARKVVPAAFIGVFYVF